MGKRKSKLECHRESFGVHCNWFNFYLQVFLHCQPFVCTEELGCSVGAVLALSRLSKDIDVCKHPENSLLTEFSVNLDDQNLALLTNDLLIMMCLSTDLCS